MTTSASTLTLISAVPELEAFLSSIPPSSTLYLDLEGNCLSRHGTITLITILIHPQRVVRLIDVLVLGNLAFTTASNNGKNLKSIFEDPDIPKCAWDVRNDADALWALYHVGLAGVTDIQLLENASRADDKTYACGLDNSVQLDLKLGFMETYRWIRTKKEVQSLMPTNVFAARPIDAKTAQYCVNDVMHLPDLHALYLRRIKGDWLTMAMEESARRVADAHSPGYDPQSPTKKLGPWGSGTKKRAVTSNKILLEEELEEQRIEDLEWDSMFGYDDDVGYYDYDENDWGGMNATDGAFCPEALDSCWDKSG
jgi:exonuclease 3'-5' domain-containing protein 1